MAPHLCDDYRVHHGRAFDSHHLAVRTYVSGPVLFVLTFLYCFGSPPGK